MIIKFFRKLGTRCWCRQKP